jgi:transcriptional regulator with XRE-family HTH domain
MSSPEGAPVSAIREAARLAVHRGKLRPVAREIGITPTTLTNFLEDLHDPQAATLQKLNVWYAQHALGLVGGTEADARSGLSLLVRWLPARVRAEAAVMVVRALVEVCRKYRIAVPRWLKKLAETERP